MHQHNWRRMAKAGAEKKKTSAKTPTLRTPSHGGGALRVGNPGNKGGGRKPDWLKQFCDDLLADAKCKGATEKILRDEDHPAFATMWKAVADRAHGKPVQAVEVSGELKHYVAEIPAKQDRSAWTAANRQGR